MAQGNTERRLNFRMELKFWTYGGTDKYNATFSTLVHCVDGELVGICKGHEKDEWKTTHNTFIKDAIVKLDKDRVSTDSNGRFLLLLLQRGLQRPSPLMLLLLPGRGRGGTPE